MSNFHGLKQFKEIDHFCNCAHDQNIRAGRFGRLFPDLPALYTDPDILRELGKKNGPMDGGSNGNRTNSVPVGHVFFGQFIDHDITLDTTSSLSSVNTPSITQLLPVVNNINSLSLYYGNPNLNPEFSHRDAFRRERVGAGGPARSRSSRPGGCAPASSLELPGVKPPAGFHRL